MNRKFIYCFTASILMSVVTFGQQAKNTAVPYKSDCHLSSFCVDCGDTKATWKSADSLTKYFYDRLNPAKIEATYGAVLIQVLIDENGKPCVKSFSNNADNTADEILALKLDAIVNNMPLWTPAKVKNKPTNVSVFLAVYSHVVGHEDFWVDYYRVGQLK